VQADRSGMARKELAAKSVARPSSYADSPGTKRVRLQERMNSPLKIAKSAFADCSREPGARRQATRNPTLDFSVARWVFGMGRCSAALLRNDNVGWWQQSLNTLRRLSFRGPATRIHPLAPRVAGPRNLPSACSNADAAARAKPAATPPPDDATGGGRATAWSAVPPSRAAESPPRANEFAAGKSRNPPSRIVAASLERADKPRAFRR
jgi:hypothetical protein